MLFMVLTSLVSFLDNIRTNLGGVDWNCVRVALTYGAWPLAMWIMYGLKSQDSRWATTIAGKYLIIPEYVVVFMSQIALLVDNTSAFILLVVAVVFIGVIIVFVLLFDKPVDPSRRHVVVDGIKKKYIIERDGYYLSGLIFGTNVMSLALGLVISFGSSWSALMQSVMLQVASFLIILISETLTIRASNRRYSFAG